MNTDMFINDIDYIHNFIWTISKLNICSSYWDFDTVKLQHILKGTNE